MNMRQLAFLALLSVSLGVQAYSFKIANFYPVPGGDWQNQTDPQLVFAWGDTGNSDIVAAVVPFGVRAELSYSRPIKDVYLYPLPMGVPGITVSVPGREKEPFSIKWAYVLAGVNPPDVELTPTTLAQARKNAASIFNKLKSTPPAPTNGGYNKLIKVSGADLPADGGVLYVVPNFAGPMGYYPLGVADKNMSNYWRTIEPLQSSYLNMLRDGRVFNFGNGGYFNAVKSTLNMFNDPNMKLIPASLLQ